jgi:hypothetical protein
VIPAAYIRTEDTSRSGPASRPGRVHIFDADALSWHATPDAGLRLKSVRYDNERGHFFGLVAFDSMVRSGLHQHRGVATSFVISGGLSDYHGSIGLHQAGINLQGATHDAIAYAPTVLVSRLEGPVVYPPQRTDLTGLHAGSRHAEFSNPMPEVPPELNIDVDRVVARATGVAGIQSQPIFDYAGTGSAHRFLQLSMRPGSVCPPWRATALTEFWVRGGSVSINAQIAHANCFVVIEPGALVDMQSPFGALLLVWAEGPQAWAQAPAAGDAGAVQPGLFGF